MVPCSRGTCIKAKAVHFKIYVITNQITLLIPIIVKMLNIYTLSARPIVRFSQVFTVQMLCILLHICDT